MRLGAFAAAGDFSGGSYLRISCREEVISLPTHRSTARGQSHLQCRSREARGGGGGEGVQGSRGGWGKGWTGEQSTDYTHRLRPSHK